MEYAFVNRSELKESMIADYFRKRCKIILRTLLILLCAAGAAWLAVLPMAAFQNLVTIRDVFSFLLLVPTAVFVSQVPRLAAKAAFWKTARPYGGNHPESVVYFGEQITSNYHGETKNWAYSEILGVCEMDWGCALEMKKFKVLLLSADAFEKGNYGEFKQFLRKKRPDLRIHT